MAWVSSLDTPARRAELERLAASVRVVVHTGTELPPRARAIVAAEVDRATAQRWAAAAPAPRRRWLAGAALRATVRRIAARSPTDDPDAVGSETGAGRALCARIEPPVEVTLGAELGAQEAAAVAAMRALGTATARSPLDDRLLGVARSIAAPQTLARTVGALALGASGQRGGDTWSVRLRDTGREIAELDEAVACPA